MVVAGAVFFWDKALLRLLFSRRWAQITADFADVLLSCEICLNLRLTENISYFCRNIFKAIGYGKRKIEILQNGKPVEVMKISVLYLLIFLPFCLIAQAENRLSDQAQKAFQRGNYALSATLWDSLHTLGYGSCASYFDAGNAYHRLHVPAKAVLNYERALRFCPQKTEIYDNLRLAAEPLADYEVPEMPPFFTQQSYHLGKNVWGILAIFWANISLFLGYRYKYKGKLKVYPFLLIVIIACMLALFRYFQTSNLPKRDNMAIVIQDSVAVKSEPGIGNKTLFSLNAGTKIEVSEELGQWWNVESGAEKGWIEAKGVEKIME